MTKGHGLYYCMIAMSDKVNDFRDLVKANWKTLVAAGFKYHTVRRWHRGERMPSEEHAKQIAAVLGVSLAQIPYFRTEHVI